MLSADALEFTRDSVGAEGRGFYFGICQLICGACGFGQVVTGYVTSFCEAFQIVYSMSCMSRFSLSYTSVPYTQMIQLTEIFRQFTVAK